MTLSDKASAPHIVLLLVVARLPAAPMGRRNDASTAGMQDLARRERNTMEASSTEASRAMGWLPDYPDFRDYAVEQGESAAIAEMNDESFGRLLRKTDAFDIPLAALPPVIDLRHWMSDVEDQGAIKSCTANAAVGLVEYFERRAFGNHIDASRLFLYKVTRNLLQWRGDTGAFLRSTAGAMVMFGVPPEECWRYVPADFDKDPPSSCYAFARDFQGMRYYRHDPPGTPREVLLSRIKTSLASGLPSMFGFTVFSSISQAEPTGVIPFPTRDELVLGGQAVVAAGYDDNKFIGNAAPGGIATKGALLVRNSWGSGWGDHGYGWLPYEYVLRALAIDWWSVVKSEWLDTGRFGMATTIEAMAASEAGAPVT
jgi:C1A family cysteine protease